MAYQGFSNTDFARSAATTLAKHIRDTEESFARNFAFMAQIEAAGRIQYNQAGRGFDWPVQYRIHDIEGNTGETERNWVRKNLWKTASLEYRGYQATDMMYNKEFKENRGEEGVVKVMDGFLTRLTTSIKQALGTHPYIDGSATGNEEYWHGLNSMFATNGTVNISTGAQRSANTLDLVAYPNDTYAGLSTVLGNYGGANESSHIWPAGIADSEYDFWSPLIAIADSQVHGGASDTFAAQGDEVMRYGLINCQRNSSMDGQIDTIMLSRNFYNDFLNLIDGKEQINITPEWSLRAMGFKNVVGFDGVEVSWEAGIPSSTGFGYNLNCIEMRCMDETMFVTEGPEYDIDTQSYRAAVSTLSNFKYKSPRNFFKVINSSAA